MKDIKEYLFKAWDSVPETAIDLDQLTRDLASLGYDSNQITYISLGLEELIINRVFKGEIKYV